jgi:hypothetical protein
MGTASGAYKWLNSHGQIPGIADASNSRLTWLGGDMPPGGASSNAKAKSDLSAWAAAGAPNN